MLFVWCLRDHNGECVEEDRKVGKIRIFVVEMSFLVRCDGSDDAKNAPSLHNSAPQSGAESAKGAVRVEKVIIQSRQ